MSAGEDRGAVAGEADLENNLEIAKVTSFTSVHEKAIGDTVSYGWDGPTDPDNPRNWSLFWRLYGTAIPAWYALGITFGTPVYAPGVFDVEADFHVSRTAALLGVTVYAIGIGLGPILGAPVSETFGRRWVYLSTMPISMLFTMGAGLAQNFGTLLVCRFFASLFGSPGIAIGAGSVADLWDLQKGGGIATVCFVLMPFLGSLLGPLIGGYAVQNQRDWRWTMWVLIIMSGPAWLATLPMKETYAKVILKKRAIKRGLPMPPKPPAREAIKMLMLVTLLRPLHMLFLEPIVAWMSLYVAFAFGILFGFFDAFPYVFGNVYHFTGGQTGLSYLGIMVGVLFAVVTFVVIDKTLYARAKARVAGSGKIPPPEERLYAALMGSLALPVSLFWFGWTSRSSIHWIVPILAGMPFGWGLILLFLGISTYLVDVYQALNAASAIAANSLLRYFFAGVFPLFTFQMYDKLGIGWASSLLGFIAIALLPTPWIFFKWGPQLRKRSAYETGNF